MTRMRCVISSNNSNINTSKKVGKEQGVVISSMITPCSKNQLPNSTGVATFLGGCSRQSV
jgi:hypothetical protein